MSRLGRIEKVEPRTIWPDEARDFTPWLADNIDLLSEAIGMDLEVVESEGAVGPFRVDIVCKDLASGGLVVIENILGPTDHDHLGKLLTYAAGREAKAAIIVATEFREEHKKVLGWLNELSGEEHLFFGVKAGVIRIADSPPAPILDPVVQPNEWEKQVKQTKNPPSPRAKAYEMFFSRLLEKVKQEIPGLTSATRVFPQNWTGFPAGKSGYWYLVSFTRDSRFKVELNINVGERDRNKDVFNRFLSQKQAIEEEFGERLSWEPLEKSCRIAVYRPGRIDDDDTRLGNLMGEGVALLKKFNSVFRKKIAKVGK
jgi:hypothetical protein